MNPIEASVSRPYTVAVAVILLVLFSLLALKTIPIQLKPTVDLPKITIETGYRGASAVEVEEQVTRELEEVLQSVQGVTEMSSTSSEGRSSIVLEFEYGTNTRLAAIDVINQLSRVPRLPPEADEPAVSLASSDQENAVMWLAVRTHYGADFARRVVEDNVRARLERVPGVSSLLVVGGSEREVQVRIDPETLVARGIRVEELLAALARGNVNVRGGTVETRGRQLAVRTVGRAEEVEGLDDLIVAETAAGSVRLGEVATVRDAFEETTGFVNIDGVSGVAIGVRRQTGANVVDLIERIDATCEEMNASFANRGLDISLDAVYRETTYINAALEFVQGNVIVGSALSILVLLVFLRSWRSILVIAVSIPISLVTVFLVMQAADRTLNVISLAGLAFASGMVVDNAIVVLENVFRHMQMGKSPLQASIDGGKEVWGGVLGSTLTTVAVFIPMLFHGDEASQIFKDIALAIASSVAISLVVSLTVVPVLTALLFRTAPKDTGDDDTTGLWVFGRWYARFTDAIGRHDAGAVAAKAGFVLVVLALCLGSVALMPSAEYLPGGNQNLVFFFASPVPGTRPEAVHENMRPFEEFVLAQPETARVFTVSGPFFNGGGVVLRDEFSDAASLAAFHRKLFMPGGMLAGFLFFVPVRASMFNDPGKQFEVELSGPDFGVLASASKELEKRVQGVAGVQFVRSSLVTGKPELHVEVDEKRAKELGLDVTAVGGVVETFVAGRRVSTMLDGGREVDVAVLAPQVSIGSTEDLESVRFLGPHGRPIALSSVARVVRTSGPESIRRLERERNVLLTVNIAADAPLERVVQEVESEVFPPLATELGASYTLAIGGSGDKLKTTLASITSGFWLSIAIIYLLLVALFRSWWTPVVILLTVPLSISGGLIGIRIANDASGGQAAFDVIAMIGFIILAGIVVNNAILIVHQANNNRADGMDPSRALAHSARTRLRPILMTVITTVAGMLPLAIGGGAGAELYQGLGAVITGGLTASTLLTLFLIPILLSLRIDWDTWRARRAARSVIDAEPAREPVAV